MSFVWNDKYGDGVSLITCTGGRPESLARCAKYVARFEDLNRLPVQWIVVNDYDDVLPPYAGVDTHFVRPQHVWSPGLNTLAPNLLAAMRYVVYDKVIFVEDDDYYAPDYMRRQLTRLEDNDLVGEAESRYYHLPSKRWRILSNVGHASLCQTAMRASLLPTLSLLCANANQQYIDWGLWSSMCTRSKYLAYGAPRVIGMKGLPGRPGIGIGHRPELGAGWHHDPYHETLRKWLGGDADLYIGPKQAAERVQNEPEPRQDASIQQI